MVGVLGAQRPKGGAGIRVPDGTITSPIARGAWSRSSSRRFPQAKWHHWEPGRAPRPARRQRAGDRRATRADYHFDKADVIVSLESDFLAGGPGPPLQRDFAARRRITDDSKAMNRLYVVESTPSLTGTQADHRLVAPASEIAGFAQALGAAVGAGAGAASRRRRTEGASGFPRSRRTCRRIAAARSSSPATISRRPSTRSRTR